MKTALAVLAGVLATVSVALAGHGGVPTVALTEPDCLKWLLDSRQPVAISIPLAELERRVAEIPTSPMVVLYRRCPLEEAAGAYRLLEARGDANHVVLQDGYGGWLRRRYPVATSGQ